MYVHTLRATDFRCFQDVWVELEVPGSDDLGNLTVLLGDNGSGKSSVLQALCLAMLGPILPASGFRSAVNIRIGTPKAEITLDALQASERDNPKGMTTILMRRKNLEEIANSWDQSFTRWPECLYDDSSPHAFLAAYGATRRVESGSTYDPETRHARMGARYQRVASIFLDDHTLVPLSAWYPRLEGQRRDEVTRLLTAVLPKGVHPTPDREAGEVVFDFRGTRVPFSSLSDGYQAHIGWVSDLLYHLVQVCPKDIPLAALPGIVLVDEVDLHLHPAWQQVVVRKLAAAFPALQLVLTTHSPLIVGGLPARHLRLLTVSESGRVRVSRASTETWGLSPDQLLLSELFGLESTRTQDFSKKLQEVERQARAGDPQASLTLSRMIAYGGAGLVADGEEPPTWVKEAAAKRGNSK